MTRADPFKVVTGGAESQRATGPAQMSLRAPAPLRRAMRAEVKVPRRGIVAGEVTEALVRGWPGLMLRKFDSDEACAAFFGRTRQTGWNWRNGHCGPDAGAVALASMVWPDDLAAILTEGLA